MVEFDYSDGRRAAVELWAVRGQVHYKDWDEDGNAFLAPLRHEEVLVRGTTAAYRHYVRVSVPDPREDKPKSVLVRTYSNEEDRIAKLNREHWLRELPPTDPRYDEFFGVREDAENINNIFETALPLRAARSYCAQGIMFDMLAHAFAINSVTRARAEKRKRQGAAA